MDNLRIRSTVKPDEQLEVNEWCNQYGVGSQYYRVQQGSFNLDGYKFNKKHERLWYRIITKLFKLKFY